MKKSIIAVVIAAIAASAQAGGAQQPRKPTPEPHLAVMSSAQAAAISLATGGTASITGAMGISGGTFGGAGGSVGNVMAGGVDLSGARIGSDVTFERSAGSAFAAPLAASNGTCSGSTSAGAQGASFGVSIGSTWTDIGCDARYDAQALQAMGMRSAAIARLCAKPEIAQAMEAAGTPCPKSDARRAEAILNAQPIASNAP